MSSSTPVARDVLLGLEHVHHQPRAACAAHWQVPEPVPWMRSTRRADEAGVRAMGEVVRGHALHAAGDGHVEGDLLGTVTTLLAGTAVYSASSARGGRDAVAHLDALGLRLGGDGGDETAALLTADEGEFALVQTAAMVVADS